MTIKRLHINSRISQIVIHNGTVYISGQISKNKAGESIEDQTKDVLAILEEYLIEAGSSKEHILSASVLISDMRFYDEFNSVWDSWVPLGYAPTRTSIQVGLVRKGIDVEVALVAAVA